MSAQRREVFRKGLVSLSFVLRRAQLEAPQHPLPTRLVMDLDLEETRGLHGVPFSKHVAPSTPVQVLKGEQASIPLWRRARLLSPARRSDDSYGCAARAIRRSLVVVPLGPRAGAAAAGSCIEIARVPRHIRAGPRSGCRRCVARVLGRTCDGGLFGVGPAQAPETVESKPVAHIPEAVRSYIPHVRSGVKPGFVFCRSGFRAEF